MIDLKDLMEERSATAPSLDTMRIVQVRRRITVRRRRISAAAGAVLIIVLFGGYLALPGPNAHPLPMGPATIGALPLYAYGGKLATEVRSDLATASIALTWQPGVREFVVVIFCAASATQDRIRVGSTLLENLTPQQWGPGSAGTCDSEHGEPYFMNRMAEGATAMFSVSMMTQQGQPALLPEGELAVGVYEPVPFPEYPLPPRPAELTALPKALTCPEGQTLLLSGADPAAPVTRAVTWQQALLVQLLAQTPGQFLIEADSAALAQLSSYDYSTRASTITWAPGPLSSWLPPPAGTTVNLTVTPTYVTGAWSVAVMPFSSEGGVPNPAYC
jgi:hypothetical protein